MSQGGHIAPIVASESSDVVFLVNVVGASVKMHELLVYEENHNLREMGVIPGISNVMAYGTSFLIRTRQREFWGAIGNFDPIPYWEKLATSSLVLYGQEDTNVPSTESTERLRSLDKLNIEVRIYEDSGHPHEDPVGKGTAFLERMP